MTPKVYSPSPVFANLPLKLAAARAAEKLYLEDGQSMFVDYIAKETARASSMLLLPAQVASTRKAANARAHHNFRRAYVEMFSYGREIASGPVLELPAPETTPVERFIRVMVDNLEAQLQYELWKEAHHDDADAPLTWQAHIAHWQGIELEQESLKAWRRTEAALNDYVGEHGWNDDMPPVTTQPAAVKPRLVSEADDWFEREIAAGARLMALEQAGVELDVAEIADIVA